MLTSPHRSHGRVGAERQMSLVARLALGVFAFAMVGVSSSHAESVDVKYRGLVDLKPFQRTEITRSSFIRRVCYDRPNQYMLINLNGTYYHYCQIDGGTVDSLLNADSMGRYFNAQVKGQFDCRVNRIPDYH
jgi:hypothetical protein